MATPERAGDRSQLRLLTSFELQCGGVTVPLTLPAQRVLGFLALQDRPVPRDYVAGTLWIDSSEEHATGSLRSALWRLRQCGAHLVETTRPPAGAGAARSASTRGWRPTGRAGCSTPPPSSPSATSPRSRARATCCRAGTTTGC